MQKVTKDITFGSFMKDASSSAEAYVKYRRAVGAQVRSQLEQKYGKVYGFGVNVDSHAARINQHHFLHEGDG